MGILLAHLYVVATMANPLFPATQPTCSWHDTPGTYPCADGHVYVHGQLDCSNDRPSTDYPEVFCLPENALSREACAKSDPQTDFCVSRFLNDGRHDSRLDCKWDDKSERKIVVCDNKSYIMGKVDCIIYKRDVFCSESDFQNDPFGCAFLVKNVSETHNCEMKVAASNAPPQPATPGAINVTTPKQLKTGRPPPRGYLQPVHGVPVPGSTP
jgi:hypothetical protein